MSCVSTNSIYKLLALTWQDHNYLSQQWLLKASGVSPHWIVYWHLWNHFTCFTPQIYFLLAPLHSFLFPRVTNDLVWYFPALYIITQNTSINAYETNIWWLHTHISSLGVIERSFMRTFAFHEAKDQERIKVDTTLFPPLFLHLCMVLVKLKRGKGHWLSLSSVLSLDSIQYFTNS